MAKVQISRQELLASGGYAVVNGRNPNTGFTPILSANPWPASLLSDLAAEETEHGYPESYKLKSAQLRNRQTYCWLTDKGMSIGNPHAYLGLNRFEANLRKWLADWVYRQNSVRMMRLPTLGEMPSIDWSTSSPKAFPGQEILDIKTTHWDLVRRVSKVLLGYEATPSQVEFARFCANSSNDHWDGATGNSGTHARLMTGAPGTFTFWVAQLWNEFTFIFRFKNLPVTPTVLGFGLEFNIFNWNGGQQVYSDKTACSRTRIEDRLTFAWYMQVRRIMWDYVDQSSQIGADAPTSSLGCLRDAAVTAWNVDYGWMWEHYRGTGQSAYGGRVQIYQDETAPGSTWLNFGALKVGRFYVCGVQPFFDGVHVQGDVVVDETTKLISIDQRRWAMSWQGKDMHILVPDLTPEKRAKLADLHIMSCFNLEGSWTTPKDPLYNLDCWADADEADMDLRVETFAEASDDNPRVTFGQANDRSSLKQTRIIHQLIKLLPSEHIAKVVILGSLETGSYARSYKSDGTLSTTQDTGAMLYALRRGCVLEWNHTFPTNEQAFYSVFDFNYADLTSQTLMSHRVDKAEESEFDETAMFVDRLPTLSPDEAGLHERSVFSMVNFSPSRKNLTDIAASGMVMMEHLRRRFTA